MTKKTICVDFDGVLNEYDGYEEGDLGEPLTGSHDFIRELRKEQYGDALDKYFRLGKNLNQRDTIAVRKMVGGFIKLLYPDGEYTKEELEEVLKELPVWLHDFNGKMRIALWQVLYNQR